MSSNSGIGCLAQLKDGSSEFTVVFLKDQLKFLTEKVKKASQELEEKEKVIQKLEHEKREYQRNFENMELENFQMQEKINMISQQNQQLTLSAQQMQKTRPSIVPKLLMGGAVV